MARSYYIFKSGTFSREQNTVYFDNAEGKRPIPVKDSDLGESLSVGII